jgi:predicted nucleic acid-binding protein
LTDDLVSRFLEAVGSRATMMQDVANAFTYERGPKDEPYIKLAIAEGAEYLVTRDHDLWTLLSR